jgi:hypothetical protein
MFAPPTKGSTQRLKGSLFEICKMSFESRAFEPMYFMAQTEKRFLFNRQAPKRTFLQKVKEKRFVGVLNRVAVPPTTTKHK